MIPYHISEETSKIIHSTVEFSKAKNFNRVIEIFSVDLAGDFENLENITSDRIIILHELTSACFNADRIEDVVHYAKLLLSLGNDRDLHFWTARGNEYLGKVFRRKTNFSEAIQYIKEAIYLYEEHFPQESKIPLFIELGICFRNIGEYEFAIENYLMALHFYIEQENLEETTKLYGNIANVYWKMEKFEDAIEFHTKSLEIAIQIADKDQIATCYGNIGNVYNSKGLFYESLEYFMKSLKIFEDENIEDGVLFALSNLGAIYLYLDELTTAEEIYSKSLVLAKKLNMEFYQASISENLGGIQLKKGNIKEAKFQIEIALSLFSKIGSKDGIAKCYKYLSEIEKEMNNYNIAKDYLEKAIEVFNELQSSLQVSEVNEMKANIYLENGSLEEKKQIESLLFKCEEVYKELNSNLHLNSVYKKLSDFYKSNLNWEKAHLYFLKFYETEKIVYTEKVKDHSKIVKYEQSIIEETAKSNAIDGILKNILPHSIAERLKNNELNIVDKHENISVYFSDIVGFTTFSQTVSPDVLIRMLNTVFSEFDSLAKQYSIEKIKTIGDAYMAVCGAPLEIPDNHIKMSRFAIAIRDFMIRYRNASKQDIHIRIGLHCGEAIAGVIGTNKFAYDLWGDTINTASRMESHGESGKIHISETFAQHLQQTDEFVITYRGETNVKGKGIMKTYWLDSKQLT